VFKKKATGRYKARLVARGFSQVYGQDYFETYAPVARLASIRTLLALAAKYQLEIQQIDVKTAFLYGDLDKEIYIKLPKGYDDDNTLVYKLVKSIYGLKQAPKVWYKVINAFFKRQGFAKSTYDLAVYIQRDPPGSEGAGLPPLIVVIYVNDLVIIRPKIAQIKQLKKALKQTFDITDLREVKNLLRMQIKRLNDRSLFLYQTRYVTDLIQRFRINEARPVNVPITAKVVPNDTSFDQKKYQRITGSVIWPSLGCRFNIAYVAGYLRRFNSAPTTAHHSAQIRVLRYLNKAQSYNIHYRSNSSKGLVAFVDAN
jgi:hypothetical protein